MKKRKRIGLVLKNLETVHVENKNNNMHTLCGLYTGVSTLSYNYRGVDGWRKTEFGGKPSDVTCKKCLKLLEAKE